MKLYAALGFFLLLITSKDTNHDGKPDLFTEPVKGRALVLKEYDLNFDGRIDRRALMEWRNDKKLMTGFSRGSVQYTVIPGYVAVWSEQDTDFDGKIDKVSGKEQKRERVGMPIEERPKF